MFLKRARLFFLPMLALLVSFLGLVCQEVGTAYASPPMTFPITNCGDDTQLRMVVTDNNNGIGGGTIIFKCSGVISITAPLMITKTLTIRGSSVILNGGGSMQIFQVQSPASFTLIGQTLVNGTANHMLSNTGSGGAIDDQSTGTVVINNSTFRFNSATDAGGAIYINGGGVVMINNSTFEQNSTTSSEGTGGAIEDEFGFLSINGSHFSTNFSPTGGGAIENTSFVGPLTLTSDSFSFNSATSGGAIFNIGPLTSMSDSFSTNSASNGGAIFNIGVATINGSTFANNTATTDGGAIDNQLGPVEAGSLTLMSDSFSTNSASLGGGLYNDFEVNIKGSTFMRNVASDGGGLYNNDIATINTTTFSKNTTTAAGAGGGISNFATVTIDESKLSGNTSQNCNGPGGIGILFNGPLDKNSSVPSRDTSCVFTN